MPRPRTPLLSREVIADAAIRIIDDGAQFGVNALARSLGVSPSSLYNHVAGAEEIIELVRGRLAERAEIIVPPGLDWDETVLFVVRAQRAMFAEHPRVLPLLVGLPVSDPLVLGYYNALADALLAAGFPDAEVLDVIALLDEFALGSGLDLTSPSQVWQADPSTTLGRLVAAGDSGPQRSERAFELGLALLVDALHARLVVS